MVQWLKAFAGFAGNPGLISNTCTVSCADYGSSSREPMTTSCIQNHQSCCGTHIYVHTGNTHAHKVKMINI